MKSLLPVITAIMIIIDPSIVIAESTSREMSFDQCLLTKAKTIASLNVDPGRIVDIVNTGIVTMTKICTDDGAVIITCSKPDRKMVITTSGPCM